MRRGSPFDALSLGAIVLAVVVTAGVYHRLPAQIATHFDAHGVADGFMPRAVGAWAFLGVAIVTWLVLRLLPRLFPRSWQARMDRSPMAIVAFLVTALFVLLHVAILFFALEGTGSAPSLLSMLLGLFWMALALVLPRVRRNPLVGIRTPWTLTSDELWARTHRFGGYTFAAGGLVAVVASLAGTMVWAVAAIVLSGLLPVVYSFLIWRKVVD